MALAAGNRVGSVYIHLGVTTDMSRFTTAANQAAVTSNRMRNTIVAGNQQIANSFSRAAQAVSVMHGPLGGVASRLSAVGSLARGSSMGMASLAAGFAAASFGMAKFLQQADGMQRMANNLRTVTTGASNLTHIQRELFEVSQRARVGMEGTVTLYSRMARATEYLGYSQEKLLRVTETVQKSFAVGGATAQEAMGAAIQLSQGIASDRFSGDEFRSVAENAPVLLREMAKQLGVNIGKLREMAHAGELTGKVVVDAIHGASEAMDKDFNKTISTMEQSFVRLGNEINQYVYGIDKSYGITQTLASGINALADSFEDLAWWVEAAAVGMVAFAGGRVGAAALKGGKGYLNDVAAHGLFARTRMQAKKDLDEIQKVLKDINKARKDIDKQIADAENRFVERASRSQGLYASYKKAHDQEIVGNERLKALETERDALRARHVSTQNLIVAGLKKEQDEARKAMRAYGDRSTMAAAARFRVTGKDYGPREQERDMRGLAAAQDRYRISTERLAAAERGTFDPAAVKAYGTEVNALQKELNANYVAQHKVKQDIAKAQREYVEAQKRSPEEAKKLRGEADRHRTTIAALVKEQKQLGTEYDTLIRKQSELTNRVSLMGAAMARVGGFVGSMLGLLGGAPGIALMATFGAFAVLSNNAAKASRQTSALNDEMRELGLLAEAVSDSDGKIESTFADELLLKVSAVNREIAKMESGQGVFERLFAFNPVNIGNLLSQLREVSINVFAGDVNRQAAQDLMEILALAKEGGATVDEIVEKIAEVGKRSGLSDEMLQFVVYARQAVPVYEALGRFSEVVAKNAIAAGGYDSLTKPIQNDIEELSATIVGIFEELHTKKIISDEQLYELTWLEEKLSSGEKTSIEFRAGMEGVANELSGPASAAFRGATEDVKGYADELGRANDELTTLSEINVSAQASGWADAFASYRRQENLNKAAADGFLKEEKALATLTPAAERHAKVVKDLEKRYGEFLKSHEEFQDAKQREDFLKDAADQVIAWEDAAKLVNDAQDRIQKRAKDMTDGLVEAAMDGEISIHDMRRAMEQLAAMNPDLSHWIREILKVAEAAVKVQQGMEEWTAAPSQGGRSRYQPGFLNLPKTVDVTPTRRVDPYFEDPDQTDRKRESYDKLIRSAEHRISQMKEEIDLIGKSGIEIETARFKLDLLHRAKETGIDIGDKEIAKINELVEAYRRYAEAATVAAEMDDIRFQTGLIGKTDGDKDILERLRQLGIEADSANGRMIAGGLRNIQVQQKLQDELEELRDIGKDALGSIVDLLYETGDIGEKLIGIFAGIGKQFAKMGMDRLWKWLSGEDKSQFDSLSGIFPDMAGGGRGFSPVHASQVGREIGQSIAPPITESLNSNLTSFAAAIRKIESGSYAGNYNAEGRVLTSGSYAGDRAYGAYQVMGRNIESWTKEALGHSLTIQQFVADRAAQDKVFFHKFGQSLDKFGNFADATSVWFSGRPMSRAGNASDGNLTVPQYVKNANEALAGYPGELKSGVSDGVVDGIKRTATRAATGHAAAEAPGVAGGKFQDMLGVGGAALGAFAGGMQSGDPLMGGISGALSGLGAAPMLANLLPGSMAAMATPIGLIGGAIIGLIGGLIGKARQKRQQLKQAQQELESQMGAILDLIATATGNFMGTFQKMVVSTSDEFTKAISMAEKAKNTELAIELRDAQDEFFRDVTERWERGFDGMVASMEAGLGFDGPFLAGMDAVEKMRESLVGFVNDAAFFEEAAGDLASVIKAQKTRFGTKVDEVYDPQAEYAPFSPDGITIRNEFVDGYLELGTKLIEKGVAAFVRTGGQLYDTLEELESIAKAAGYALDETGELVKIAANDNAALAAQVERARQSAIQTALAMISGAEEFTAMEDAVQKLHGTVAGMPTLLKDLGMSAEDAAAAIDEHVNVALWKMRDAYRNELNSSINSLSGFGFLNDIVDTHRLYEARLKDSSALGIDSSLALREVNLALADIVQTAGLTQIEIDMLAAAFPMMAGLIETVAGKDAMAVVRDAESDLRAAYEKQRSEIEQTISRLERFTESVKRFRDEMRLSGSSPLSQREQMEEALRQFRETAALALEGDEEALGNLTSVSQAALDEAQAYYASSEKYAEIWREIDNTLAGVEANAVRQLSEQQRELDALNNLVGGWITINDSILSVEAAIAKLAGAMSARDVALQTQIEAAKNSLVDPRHGQIQDIYQTVLGRTGSSSEIGWWANTDKSIGTIRADIEWAKMHGSYATGGFTGLGGINQVAGVVHGQEFVAHAEATRRWRPQLEAMNAGGNPFANDNGAVVAAIGRLEQQNRELHGEVKRLQAVVAAGANATVGAVKEGNAEMAEVSTELKRANSR